MTVTSDKVSSWRGIGTARTCQGEVSFWEWPRPDTCRGSCWNRILQSLESVLLENPYEAPYKGRWCCTNWHLGHILRLLNATIITYIFLKGLWSHYMTPRDGALGCYACVFICSCVPKRVKSGESGLQMGQALLHRGNIKFHSPCGEHVQSGVSCNLVLLASVQCCRDVEGWHQTMNVLEEQSPQITALLICWCNGSTKERAFLSSWCGKRGNLSKVPCWLHVDI